MKIPDPGKYFQEFELEESLLLRVMFYEVSDDLEIVISYANVGLLPKEPGDQTKPQEQNSEFRKFLFRKVTNLEKQKVFLKIGNPAAIDYQSARGQGDQVVQGVVIKREGSLKWHIEISFGTFGTYSFCFQDLEVLTRFVNADPVSEGERVWKDVETGECVNIYHPFSS